MSQILQLADQTPKDHSQKYEDIDIVKDGDRFEDAFCEEFCFVRDALEGNMFNTNTTKIKILGVHFRPTSVQADGAHIILLVEPGSYIVRLYLELPDEGDLHKGMVTHAVPPRSDSNEFWVQSPTCGEATKNHSAHFTAKNHATHGQHHPQNAVMARCGLLWDNKTKITYSFIDTSGADYVAKQKAKVVEVIKEWEKYANIEFAPAANGGDLRISFDREGGSWSFTGKENLAVAADEATMNLGWVYGDSSSISADERGVILHEFGHALGLMHEHQSPARGEKITLKEDAVMQFYTETQRWSEEEVKEQIIRVYNASQISNYSALDTTSIMMYFMPGAMNTQGLTIPPNNELSETDKAFMIINYPPANRSQFLTALEGAGVPWFSQTDILAAYDDDNWRQVRLLFTAFCIEARSAPQGQVGGETSVKGGHAGHAVQRAVKLPMFECLAEEASLTSPNGAQRGAASMHDFLWLPGEEITYCFIQELSEATTYRMKRVKETFEFYAKRANLSFREIPYLRGSPDAKIRIFFSDIPNGRATAWCKIGRDSVGFQQSPSEIKQRGGTVDTSMNFSDIVPKEAPTDGEKKVREMRTLYHEIGHSLGLRHEHNSPYAYSEILDHKLDYCSWLATAFDKHSVMLYSGQTLSSSSDGKFYDVTEYNYEPSQTDLAFIGAVFPRPEGNGDRFLQDLLDLGITETQPYLQLRRQAFKYFNSLDFSTHIEVLRTKLQRDLRLLALGQPAVKPASMVLPPRKQRAVANPTTTATSGSFLDELMKQLSAFFRPTSGQLFALQFPGRFLQKDLFAWDTTKAGIYGQFVKPTVVNESEFRLVDQLYNVGTVIGGPSGLNLSIVYEQVLNNIVPGIQQSQINFSKQQGQIRHWLMKDVPTSGWVKDLIASQHTQGPSGSTASSGAAHAIKPSASSLPSHIAVKPQFAVANKLTGDDHKVNRLELAAALMQEYLAAKQAWELERDEMMKNASGQELDALSRRLAHITAIREEQLASKYGDAVVRGYSHAIRQYLGYMDIKTPAEALQDAKDALRESASSSFDGSMKVYPVQMQPIDWFQSLSTSFTMEDLTANPDLIMQQIDSKSKQLDALNSRLAVLQGKPKIDVQSIQRKLDSAQEDYDRANADLTSSYSTNIISLARACINANNEFVLSDFNASAKSLNIAGPAFDKIESGMNALTKASLEIKKQSRALTQLMAAKSLAEATDTTQEITETTLLINALTKDISELTARLQSMRYKDGASTAVPPVDHTTPSTDTLAQIPLLTPDISSGGSRWQDFSFSHEIDTKYSASSTQNSASNRSTSVPLFFGSYQSDSQSASASLEDINQSKSLKIEVGFRATLVTVDRGGWFQPQFFKQSAGFHSIDPTITWSKWPENVKTVQDLSGGGSLSAAEAAVASNELNKHLLPAYPTGFIICKDITIKIHLSSTDIHKSASEMEAYAATSAGILCFSTSSSDSSQQSDKAYGFKVVADGCVIRIPGPQILGYMLQFTDPDTTTVIPETLPDGFLISDAEYDSTISAKQE